MAERCDKLMTAETVAEAGEASEGEVLYRIGALDFVAMFLLLLGAFNWGLVAAFGVDPISEAFGFLSPLTRSLHAVIGLAPVYAVFAVGRALKKF